ncbi:MAG: hypothetical protein ISS69_05580 [Phycisphaerae bacterium]|nr:hypothetical protein [Phycisphaerae bacterium]
MQMKGEFTVDETTFKFESKPGGGEVISVDGEICSSKWSLFGGKHIFEYQGDQYSVKVKPGFRSIRFKVQKNGRNTAALVSEPQDKIPLLVYFACGWPFILAVPAAMMGGAIDAGIAGGLAGLAFGLSIGIYKSSMSKPLKVLLVLLIGVLAGVLQILFIQHMVSQGASLRRYGGR